MVVAKQKKKAVNGSVKPEKKIAVQKKVIEKKVDVIVPVAAKKVKKVKKVETTKKKALKPKKVVEDEEERFAIGLSFLCPNIFQLLLVTK